MHSSSQSASEVAPTEGSVTAFMEILVDPLLSRMNLKHDPTVEQQLDLAKQIHAVVLLYNYYQRKRHPELEYLGFESFCRLAVTLNPIMMPFLSAMHQSNNKAVSDDAPEYQLTLTEEAIKEACNLCLALDVPVTEEWPITKVVVMLVDSGEENCALVVDSVTQGLSSFLEKSLDNCEISSGSTVPKKRRRINKNNLEKEQNSTEAGHEQLAFSAIKESTGFNENDLVVLENHVVYSLSKEKTSTRFYIVKCRGTIKVMNKYTTFKVSIKKVLESLQGPLVYKCMEIWTATRVAEHLHFLPYAGIIFKRFSSESALKEAYLEEWHQRTGGDRSQAHQELLHEGLQRTGSDSSQAAPELPNDTKNELSSSCFDDLGLGVSIFNSKSNDASGAPVKSPMKEDNITGDVVGPTCFVSGPPHSMETGETAAFCGHKEDVRMAGKVYQHHKKRTSTKSDRTVSAVGVKNMVKPMISKCKDEKVDTVKMSCGNVSMEQEKMAAFRVLLQKRDRLSRQLPRQARQLQSTGDEIAICDKNIRTILNRDYLAYVTVKGKVCHWSFNGGVHSSPVTAVDSAAAQMIANLRILMPKL